MTYLNILGRTCQNTFNTKLRRELYSRPNLLQYLLNLPQLSFIKYGISFYNFQMPYLNSWKSKIFLKVFAFRIIHEKTILLLTLSLPCFNAAKSLCSFKSFYFSYFKFLLARIYVFIFKKSRNYCFNCYKKINCLNLSSALSITRNIFELRKEECFLSGILR